MRWGLDAIEVYVVVTVVGGMCPGAYYLRSVVEASQKAILVEVKCLFFAMRRNVVWEGGTQSQPRRISVAHRSKDFELKPVSKENERCNEIVPNRIATEIDKIKTIPIEPSAKTPKR